MRARRLLGCLALGFALSPREADACGGTFCDTGPQAMPVDQSGENILFVLDGTTVEAHVQIQYQGSAERFAWVVPMPAVPEVSVGSQPLFTRLLQSSVPTYAMQTQNDNCGGGGGAGGALSMGGSSSGGGGSGGADAGGPQVVFEKTVGAFEVVALKGGTAVEVVDWLQNNNYQNIPSAPQILQDYVVKNYVFVAIKLTAGAGLDEIHPLVFKYPGNEPCVPLKLTRVAATEDMAVRAFFLGNDRVVPLNYRHVTLNPVQLNWLSLGANYKAVVSKAVDSAVANGRSFVTEYAGKSNIVSPVGVFSSVWNAAPFQSIAPEAVVDELGKQGLAFCSGGGACSYGHPLVQSLLNEYLPVPSGVKEADFYGCLSCNSALIDKTKWNASEFASAFSQRIVEPAVHAKALLDKWPYLTRLYTTISPAEMTEDPIFQALPGLPDVQAYQLAVRRVACDGKSGMILPDDREVALDGAFGWPSWSSAMPFAEDIEEFKASGVKLTLVDNTAEIDALLSDWNQQHGWPPKPSGGAGGTGTGGYSPGTGGFYSGTGGSGQALSPGGGGGCGVSPRSPLTGLVLLAGLLVFALGRRRRRA